MGKIYRDQSYLEFSSFISFNSACLCFYLPQALSRDAATLLPFLRENPALWLSAEVQQIEGIRRVKAVFADHTRGAAASALGVPCGPQELLEHLREYRRGWTVRRTGIVGKIQTAREFTVTFQNTFSSPHCFCAHGGTVFCSWESLVWTWLTYIALFNSFSRMISVWG